MNHSDHVRLLRGGIPASGPATWADLGSGGGAFTVALAELLGPTGHIISVDKDSAALREQQRRMRSTFPDVAVTYMTADFTRSLPLSALDGIVMANSLHFIRPADKDAVLQHIRGYLKPGGRLILVEYNVDRGNMWVPHPLSYTSWERLAEHNGFVDTRLLEVVPSSFLGQIYAALSLTESL